MPINFPSNPATPFNGGTQPEVASRRRADEAARTQSTQQSLGANATSNDNVPPPVAGTNPSALFVTGGRIDLEAPPQGSLSGPDAKLLSNKFQQLLDADGKESGDVQPNGATTGKDGVGSLGATPGPSPRKAFRFEDILHLLLNVSVEQFKEAREEAHLDLEEKVSEMRESASEIEKAAADRKAGAIFAAAGQIVAGSAGVLGGAAGGVGAFKGNAAIDASMSATEQAATFQRASAGWNTAGSIGQSVGGVGQGGLNVGQADEESKAAGEDAAKARADTAAADEDALHENAVSMRQQYMGVMQDFIEKEKSWEQSQDQTMMTLARNV